MKSAIVFPGQGSQVVGMGKDIYDKFSTAREVFAIVDEAIGANLSKIIFNGPEEELIKTKNTQPALMAVSIAIINVLEKEFGKDFSNLCSFTAGHSLGEYSALCAAKSIDIFTTAKLLKVRGEAMSRCAEKYSGAMAAILGAEVDVVRGLVQEAAQGDVCQIANDNSVGQIVISGSKSAVSRAIEIAKSKGIKRAILLPVSGAFHSELMKEAQEEILEALAKTSFSYPKVKLVSNINADVVNHESEIPNLLVKQITGSVRWRETMIFLKEQGVDNIIEIGSGKVLAGLATRTCETFKTISIQNSEDISNLINILLSKP